MVTGEERDYMYQHYAEDPRARLNAGIRRRLAPLLSSDRGQIKLFTALLLSLPGSPVLYYGDEIGMGDNIWLGDRDGVRTPMQWSVDRNGGFSRCDPNKLYLPVNAGWVYGYNAVNVERQIDQPDSLLQWTRQMVEVRKRYRALAQGTFEDLRRLQPVGARVPARVVDDERQTRDRPLCPQPVPASAAGAAQPVPPVPQQRAGRAHRGHGVPEHRPAPVPADAAGLRLVLVQHRPGPRLGAQEPTQAGC